MGSVDRFVQAIQQRLRCPVERRATVLEELRAHLDDRTEALLPRWTRDQAERRAVREMGPAWRLALRLSMANGWHIAPWLVRHVWAASLGLLVLAAGASPFVGVSRMDWQLLKVDSAGFAAFVFIFGYGVAQLARGWLWATVPLILLTPSWVIGGDRAPADTAVWVAAICLCVGAMLGDRPGATSRRWAGWVGASGAVIWPLAWSVWQMSVPWSYAAERAARGWFSGLLDTWLGYTADEVVMIGIAALASWALARGLEWWERRSRPSRATA